MNSAAMTIAFKPKARCKRDRRWVYVAHPVMRSVSHERVAAASVAESGAIRRLLELWWLHQGGVQSPGRC